MVISIQKKVQSKNNNNAKTEWAKWKNKKRGGFVSRLYNAFTLFLYIIFFLIHPYSLHSPCCIGFFFNLLLFLYVTVWWGWCTLRAYLHFLLFLFSSSYLFREIITLWFTSLRVLYNVNVHQTQKKERERKMRIYLMKIVVKA